MPDDRLQRTRPTLPAGYQFGDARLDAPTPACTCGAFRHTSWWLHWSTCAVYQTEHAKRRAIDMVTVPFPNPWRAPHDNAAEQLQRNAVRKDTETFTPAPAVSTALRGMVGVVSRDWYRCPRCEHVWAMPSDGMPQCCPACDRDLYEGRS